MVLKFWSLIILVLVGWPCPALADFMGGIELKTTHYDNFNLAYGGAAPLTERVNTVQAGLTWYKASSKDFVWLLKGIYSYNEYDRYHYLTGSSAILLGGMFYRFNSTNSATLEIGRREKRYDNEELSLYEDDARLANLKFSHRLSPTLLLNEKAAYEENDPRLAANQFHVYSGQVWFEWKIGSHSTLSAGYIASRRIYDNSGGTEYTFEEPYAYYGYGLGRHWYTRIGVSRIKIMDQASNTAYNETAYLAIGTGI